MFDYSNPQFTAIKENAHEFAIDGEGSGYAWIESFFGGANSKDIGGIEYTRANFSSESYVYQDGTEQKIVATSERKILVKDNFITTTSESGKFSVCHLGDG